MTARANWFVALITGFLVLGAALPPAHAALVSRSEVIRASEEAAAQIEREEGLVRSNTAQRRVRRIGNEMAALAKYADGTVYAFQILDSEEINAFSLASGHVYVTRGLLDAIDDDEDMLAAVLAHEIGHIAEGHVFDRTERALEQSLGLTILDQLLGKKLGKVGRITLGLAHEIALNDYSQGQERESDEYGVVLLHVAKRDPEAMARFLDILAQQEQKIGALKYLRTHPYSATRSKWATEFLAEILANKVTLTPYLTPRPESDSAAFTYDYPSYTRRSASN